MIFIIRSYDNFRGNDWSKIYSYVITLGALLPRALELANQSYCSLISKFFEARQLVMNIIPPPPFPEGPPQPTQGLLIDLLDQAEDVCSKNPALCLKHVLAAWFHVLYPTAKKITRPCRFESTIRRIAGPTKPSTRGERVLMGAELEVYRSKPWVPKLGQSTDINNKGK